RQYNYSPLGFTSNYRSLPDREKTELGHGALNDAIRNLYYIHSQPSALLTQGPEAWRTDGRIYPSRSNGVMRQAALALMLYRCNPKAKRVPVPVAVAADEQCLDGEPTTNIIRMAGKCVDVYENQYDNGTPIILFSCGNAKANCVSGTEPRQQWALYGDRNIRLYSDRTLCVTSNGHESSDSIFLLKGQGSGDERWTFMADGTILNPNARLVIDVWSSDVSLKEIIMYEPTAGDLFYQRMLLCHQKGCKSFLEIRMLGNTIYPTNKAACQALGLLSGDEEWIGAFQEAALFATSS
nr:ribosome-inactivating protein [Tanacetum cinerariifolium]